jgi:5'-nucleotidase (lipoprotein e(P4) family)
MLNATLRNLQSAGFPQADESHVLLMASDASKESRRKTVVENHEIVLLLGDNLNDLSNAFEGGTISDRAARVDSARAQFGSRYIVLPNPVYGAWESAVYQYKSGLTEEQKDTMRKSILKSFE